MIFREKNTISKLNSTFVINEKRVKGIVSYTCETISYQVSYLCFSLCFDNLDLDATNILMFLYKEFN